MKEEFLALTPAGQVRYLKTEEFAALEKDKQVAFLKEIATSGRISSKCLACTLKILRELRFRDRSFFKKFLGHPDSSVIMACKKALSDRGLDSDSGFFTMRELVKKQNNEKKLQAVKLIVSETGQAGDDMLISFLSEDNLRVREMVVKELSGRPHLDESKLLGQLVHSVWYTRAALVEILGNRRSPRVLEKIDELLADPNVEVRLQLLAALAKLEREQVKEYVLRLTRDAHVRVSKEAKRILSTI
ncbi:MAG: HEAT repeat domain-containing protein [Candidatus Aminicenantes bacterium]|nr:HEAT repeat domain-containing protein [Candidatus Aminicenantes bacterium]